ncbi:hypothetical protein SAMN05192564_1011091 [Paraburkholderia sartisoli]|uniref:Uncharacterized protein n=1 Tax=Paraburkholderia sartisoli TaxID=83784 RepID=A0A1H4A9W8_9BURK|nr:hypothetical protein SAMN05192564_1011091 [Paraburkholderia sartisoli]
MVSNGWALLAAQCLRFLPDFGYATGLRAGDLVGVTPGGIVTGTRGAHWLHLTGKGAKASREMLRIFTESWPGADMFYSALSFVAAICLRQLSRMVSARWL